MNAAASSRPVVVVIGAGGMGQAIARRQGAGHQLLLADFNAEGLETTAATLRGEGYDVATRTVDVSSRASVESLAAAAAELGEVQQLINTAGLSPMQAPVAAILNVDLLGVALVLEVFGEIIAPGGAGVVIASAAGYGAALQAADEQLLATTPADDLLGLPVVTNLPDPGVAYTLAKRGNHVRVQAASAQWGQRGARVNSVSPGVVATPMGQQELDGQYGEFMRAMIANSPVGRVGTPTDIADAVAFLLGPTASLIAGIDLLVDAGSTGAARAHA